MKIKTVHEWSEETSPRTVAIVVYLLVVIMLGLYAYAGVLITKLF